MESRKTHFMFVLKRMFSFVVSTIVPYLIFVFIANNGTEIRYYIWAYILLFGLVFVSSLLKWNSIRYEVNHFQLKIKSGWLLKKNTIFPVEKVQGINLTTNFIYNLLDIVQLKVETAGVEDGSSVDVIVKKEEAQRIQALIYPEEHKQEITEEKDMKITFTQLIIMSCTSMGVFIGFPVLYGLYFQLKEIFSEKMDTFIQESRLLNSYQILNGELSDTSLSENIFWFALFLIALLGVAWLIGTVSILFKYKGFRLLRKDDKIILEHGFFVLKTIAIPVSKIQALKVSEGLFRQPFGLAAIKVESIGYGSESGGETILMPLIKKKEINRFLADFMPEYHFEVDLVSAPFKSLKYYLVRGILSATALILGIWYFYDYGYLLFWLLPVIILLPILRQKDAGLLISNEMIYLRRRNFSKETLIIPNSSIQSVDVKQHCLQRKDEIASYEISIASEEQSKSFTVKDLPVSEREKLLKWLFLSQKQQY